MDLFPELTLIQEILSCDQLEWHFLADHLGCSVEKTPEAHALVVGLYSPNSKGGSGIHPNRGRIKAWNNQASQTGNLLASQKKV